jgi:hypothetical protein
MEPQMLIAVKEAADAANMKIDRMANILGLFLMRAAEVQGPVGHAVLRGLADELSALT